MAAASGISLTDVLTWIQGTLPRRDVDPRRHASVAAYLAGGPIPNALKTMLNSTPVAAAAQRKRGRVGLVVSSVEAPSVCGHRRRFRTDNCTETTRCMECCRCNACRVAVCAVYARDGSYNFTSLPKDCNEINSLQSSFLEEMRAEIVAARIESGGGSGATAVKAGAGTASGRQVAGASAAAAAAASSSQSAARRSRTFGFLADSNTAREQLRSALVIVAQGGAVPTTILSMPHVIAVSSQLIAFYQTKAALPGSRAAIICDICAALIRSQRGAPLSAPLRTSRMLLIVVIPYCFRASGAASSFASTRQNQTLMEQP